MSADFDPTLPENYGRLLECGEQQGALCLGLHCWFTCDTCGTASYWGYGISEAGKNHTDAERAENLILLSQYRVAPEDENAMADSDACVAEVLELWHRLGQQLRGDAA